jgi:hypothetical protein
MILHQSANSVCLPVKGPGSPMSHALKVSFLGLVKAVAWSVFLLVPSFVIFQVCWLILLLICVFGLSLFRFSFLFGFGFSVCFKHFWFSVPSERSFGSFALGAGLLADRFWSCLTTSAHSLVVSFL